MSNSDTFLAFAHPDAACNGTWRTVSFFVGDESRYQRQKDTPQRRQLEAPAKLLCARCPVQADCLDFALEHNIRFGIWGGMNMKERHQEAFERASRQVPA